MKKKLITLLVVITVALATGCEYKIKQFARVDPSPPSPPEEELVACGHVGIEAGQDDPDVDTLQEVGLIATTAVRVGNCNGPLADGADYVSGQLQVARRIGPGPDDFLYGVCGQRENFAADNSNPQVAGVGYRLGEFGHFGLPSCDSILQDADMNDEIWFRGASTHLASFGEFSSFGTAEFTDWELFEW